VRLHLLNATTIGEIDAAFATLPQLRVGALLISAEFFLSSRAEQTAALSAKYAVPAIYPSRFGTVAGGLMGYGIINEDIYREIGVYVGRILKGEKPADLPVQQITKVEFVINLKTAKALGLTFPLPLLGRADEVIE
jgi:putative ABC transport system substrate-binding protein